MKLPPNLNFGIAGRPLDPLVSTPSPCPRAGSPEAIESFTLAISSFDFGIPASQVEGVEKMGYSNEDVVVGAGKSSSQFVDTGNRFVFSSSSIPTSL